MSLNIIVWVANFLVSPGGWINGRNQNRHVGLAYRRVAFGRGPRRQPGYRRAATGHDVGAGGDRLGERAYPAAMDQYGGALPKDSAMQAYVGRVGKRVAGVSHCPDLPWDFTVVESEEINAFALPGGKIAITRGLRLRLPDEDSLAFVLAHEAGHVTARHFVSRHAKSSLINLGKVVGHVPLHDKLNLGHWAAQLFAAGAEAAVQADHRLTRWALPAEVAAVAQVSHHPPVVQDLVAAPRICP